MSEDPPKQELLLKLLKMTTSDNDGEALTAIRKANELLISASWDWDKLIHAKIRVIGDPFGTNVNIPTPTNDKTWTKPPRTPPQPASHGYTAAPQQSTPPPPPPRPRIDSVSPNRYAGHCYCCGTRVDQRAGWIFDPSKLNGRAQSKWVIACDTCNASRYIRVGPTAATRAKSFQPGLGDI